MKPPENSKLSPQPDKASDSRAVPAAPPALLRRMPSVNLLLGQASVRALQATVPARILTEAARSVLEQTRQELLASAPSESALPVTSQKKANEINKTVESEDTFSSRIGLESLAARTAQEALRRHAPSLQPAINATGIILHTGLGRARLAPEASDALLQVAMGHANVEIDRETGQRGSRREHVQGLLCELTGAEDATVVNNCAGAVFLAVNALAAGREVIISRGELVEIGGAFRMPDIIRASGATLVEVGTTNRTRLSDYRNAITERTGLILRCQPSNFVIIGFTEETTTRDLVSLGRERGIPVLDDQGSGALLSLDAIGVQDSPGRTSMKGTLRDSVLAGADLVMASGDKLLGGPQAGMILGRREYIERIVSHPLARALRVDKFTLAALEATLRLYRDPEQAKAQIPTLRYLARTEPELRRMAQRLRAKLRAVLPADRFTLELLPEYSQVGGGALPDEDLPTVCVRLCAVGKTPDPDTITRALRLQTPAIFARIKGAGVLFDPRTLEPAEIDRIAASAHSLLALH